MFVLSLTFIALSAAIIVAAMWLAKFGDQIAVRTGLGGSVVGLVLLAGATSLPELSVGYSAVRMDAVDLTAGGVLGSSLVNLLILALADLISRRPGRILTRGAAAHALSATVGMLLTGIVLLGILEHLPYSFMGVGPPSWGVVIVYALCARLLFLDERESSKQAAAEISSIELNDTTDRAGALALSGTGFALSAAVIFFVAPQLARTADTIAEVTGLGRTFIGTLFLAVVTSLPEAVSTIAAVRLGAVDMAIANIFGSNAFNMVILATLDWASPTPILGAVSSTHAITATCVIIITSVALLSILNRAEKRWWLIEPDAALVALLVIGAMFLVYVNG